MHMLKNSRKWYTIMVIMFDIAFFEVIKYQVLVNDLKPEDIWQ